MIKSRRLKLVGQVARMGEKKNLYRLLVESQKERDNRKVKAKVGG
jgi:hypothetical protein